MAAGRALIVGYRILGGLLLALFVWMGWHEIGQPLDAMRHGAEGVRIGLLGVVLVPAGIGLFGTLTWLGPRMGDLLEDEDGRQRPVMGAVLIVLIGVGIAIRMGMVSHAQGAGYAEPERHDPFTMQMPTATAFGAERITFTREDGRTRTMLWSEITSIALVGGSKDFTSEVESHWQFDDSQGTRGIVPAEAIDETVLVAAVRSHFGAATRDRPVERFAADLNDPANAKAVAKGFAQFAEWVYTR